MGAIILPRQPRKRRIQYRKSKEVGGRMTRIESESLKLAVMTAVSRSSVLPGERRGAKSLSTLLGDFVNLDCTEEAAARHWQSILDRREAMSAALGRSVSLQTAIADYCAEPGGPLASPFLVEGAAFRDTMRQAMIDGLTGAFNRRYMEITLRKEYNRCERWGKSLSVCMIDIDNFKKINDTKGHQFGDEVLVRLSSVLMEAVRDEDVLCRYGGEEFIAILPETDEEGVLTLGSRLHAAVKRDAFLSEHGVTFSAGLATYPDIKTVDALIAAADRALYQAKYNGKDQIVPAIPERRKFGRFPYSWDLSIVDERTREELTGINTLNVSLGGVQFVCAEPYNVDLPLHLVFRNSITGVAEIDTESRISWVKKTRDGYLYGVRFDESPHPLKERIEILASPPVPGE